MARPRPNLGSGAHAAGISEAKGAQPSGGLAAPLRVAPGERESLGRGVTKERAMTRRSRSSARSRAHVQDRRELHGCARPVCSRNATVPGGPYEARGVRRSPVRREDQGCDRQEWDAWFSILDRWGAREKKHGRRSVPHGEHQALGWWAQSITVGYERARGMRLKHQQADGFTIYASKTIAVPIDVLFDAFVNPRSRRKWPTGGDVAADLATGPHRPLQTGGTARRA